MTTPERSPLGEAADADVAEQQTAVSDTDDDSWPDAVNLAGDRDWEANEADVVEQAMVVPDDPDDHAGLDR